MNKHQEGLLCFWIYALIALIVFLTSCSDTPQTRYKVYNLRTKCNEIIRYDAGFEIGDTILPSGWSNDRAVIVPQSEAPEAPKVLTSKEWSYYLPVEAGTKFRLAMYAFDAQDVQCSSLSDAIGKTFPWKTDDDTRYWSNIRQIAREQEQDSVPHHYVFPDSIK